jgi:hypothetical protein
MSYVTKNYGHSNQSSIFCPLGEKDTTLVDTLLQLVTIMANF